MAEPIIRPKEFERVQGYIGNCISIANCSDSPEKSKILCDAYSDCAIILLSCPSISSAVELLKGEDNQMFDWLIANPQSEAYASVDLRRSAFVDVLNYIVKN